MSQQQHLLFTVDKLLLINHLYSFLSGANDYFLVKDLYRHVGGRSNKNITNRAFITSPTLIRAKN